MKWILGINNSGRRIPMSMSLSLELTHNLCLEQKLQLEDCYTVKHTAICPECKHKLIRKEIEAGFMASDDDFRTTCPKCGVKFLSHLRVSRRDEDSGKKVFLTESVLMCQQQTLYQMRRIKAGRGRIGHKWLSQVDPNLYYSMLWNFKSYHVAMEQLRS
jgi:DNA-directed RNA polymerase subunit RPC12/RpoP